MNSRLVYRRPVLATCVSKTGAYLFASRAAWDELLSLIEESGHRATLDVGYALIRGNPTGEVRYEACIRQIAGLAERFAPRAGERTLPGGTFLEEHVECRNDEIPEALARVVARALPAKGLRIDTSHLRVEIPARELVSDGNSVCHVAIYVPIAAETASVSALTVRPPPCVLA